MLSGRWSLRPHHANPHPNPNPNLNPNPNPNQGSKLALAVPEMFLYFVIICYLVHFAVKLGRTKTVTGKFSNHFRDPCARPSPTREL